MGVPIETKYNYYKFLKGLKEQRQAQKRKMLQEQRLMLLKPAGFDEE